MLQEQEAGPLALLDEDSQQVLGLLARPPSPPPAAAAAKGAARAPSRFGFPTDITNRTADASVRAQSKASLICLHV